ncbi:histidine phosphatase family protein [Roseomonas sp. USHLN139]|uniref:histidine phosphatase family protein n=1 Tax=Roseomonas sp. USHLN139 TaxID=3081298 RepID=UPI003B017866
MATTLFLLRHAAHGELHRLCGRLPGIPLGEAGRAQAAWLGARLRREALEAVYTSPLQRCRETAAAIGAAVALAPAIEPDATEIEVGAWSGQSFEALAVAPGWDSWNAERDRARPPGGESMAEVTARITALIERLRQRHPAGRIALVSHADVIKAAVCALLGLGIAAHARFEVAPASLTACALWPGGGKLLRLNETGDEA